jgi:hypothetical protein
MTSSPAAPVVVGVDGSPESLRALDWAAREAAARQSPMRILHAFLRPLMHVPAAALIEASHDAGLVVVGHQVTAAGGPRTPGRAGRRARRVLARR